MTVLSNKDVSNNISRHVQVTRPFLYLTSTVHYFHHSEYTHTYIPFLLETYPNKTFKDLSVQRTSGPYT